MVAKLRASVCCTLVVQLFLCGIAKGDDSIWTSKPVRVDPGKQKLERLPGLVGGVEGAEKISFPSRIVMHDSTRFSANGTDYVLSDMKPVAPGRLCKSEAGARWPCGTQASVFVSNLLRNRTLFCKIERAPDHVALSGCRTGGTRIAIEIVRRGFAFPENGDSELESALTSARAQRAGIWRDAACLASVQSC